MGQEASAKRDFFVSYNRADATWAEWIAWQLEAAKYSVFLQAWDFRPGSNFVLEMHRAATLAERTLPVLSPHFLASRFTQPEWAAAFAHDPTGERGKVLPVRVAERDTEGLLGPIVYVDLVGREEDEARDELLRGVRRERAKPDAPPAFPRAKPATGGPTASVAKPARFPGALPPVWNMPHHRNPHFTGREELLEALHRTLTEGPTALTALSGLGGIGKTQTAVEYAYRHAAEFDVVWWLRAEEPATLVGAYAALAGELGLPEAGETDHAAVARAVRAALERQDRWLLVFDNAEGEDGLRELLPRGGGGRVLITSRHPDWDLAMPLKVPLLMRGSATAFLLKRTGQRDEAAAAALAAELGDLPLALEQAAAFVRRSGLTLAAYLVQFRERRGEVWRRERPPQGYPATVATTWTMAVARLRAEEPAAVDLLDLCAFLAPETIPCRLITGHADTLPPPLDGAAADPLRWSDLTASLRGYSLVEVVDDTLTVHRLVQAATRDGLTADERRRWAGAAVALLNAGFPYVENDPATWAASRELLAHALAATGHAEPFAASMEDTSLLLNEAGSYLETHADYGQARACYERALRIDEVVLGPDHPGLMVGLNNLGHVLQAQSELAGAQACYERALRIGEATLDPNHPNMASLINNLGYVLRVQGDFARAQSCYERVIRIFEVLPGPPHPNLGGTINNLGMMLWARGDLAEARAYLERALSLGEAAFGPDHPNVAIYLRNLGDLLVQMGERAAGIGHLSRALASLDRVFAADHPHVIGTRKRLRAAEASGPGEPDRSG